MSPGPFAFLPDLAVLSQPVQKTLVYAVWYSALLWLPVRLMAAMIDRRRLLRVEEVFDQPAEDDSYRIGKAILPDM